MTSYDQSNLTIWKGYLLDPFSQSRSYVSLHALYMGYCFVDISSITKNPINFTVVYVNDSITLSCNATASGMVI